MLVAIGRISKFAFAQLVPSAGKTEAAQFLQALIAALPYRIHMVLPDDGVQLTRRRQDLCDSEHALVRVCGEHGMEHQLTKAATRGSTSRSSGRTVQLRTLTLSATTVAAKTSFAHLILFVDAYNHARWRKPLRRLTSYEAICKASSA